MAGLDTDKNRNNIVADTDTGLSNKVVGYSIHFEADYNSHSDIVGSNFGKPVDTVDNVDADSI